MVQVLSILYKKFLLFSILVTATCILLPSCKSDSGKTTLSIFNYFDYTAANADVLDKEIAAFNTIHPDIEVVIENTQGIFYHRKLESMVRAGLKHDLVFLLPGKKTDFVTGKGLIKDLRPWLDDRESEFKPLAFQSPGPNGEIYMIPASIAICHIMFTNNRLLESLNLTYPKTFEELLKQGERIKAAGLIPIAMANIEGWRIHSCLLSTVVERVGGYDWWQKVVKGDGATFADTEFITALEYIKILHDNKMFSPNLNNIDYKTTLDDFTNEKAVYMIDGGFQCDELVDMLTEQQKTYISFHTFPNLPDGKGINGSSATVAGSGFGMNEKLSGAKAQAAWKWIWFYSGPEGSALHLKNGRFPAYNVPISLTEDVFIKKYIKFSETIRFYSPVLDHDMDKAGIQNILEPDIKKMMYGTLTPAQVAVNYEMWVSKNDLTRRQETNNPRSGPGL